MKYIKLFEENSDYGYEENSDYGYEEIDADDYHTGMNSMVSLSSRDIDVISEVVSSSFPDYFIKKIEGLDNDPMNGLTFFFLQKGDYIFKAYDEWFFLIIDGNYYKCDQLDGLLNCLKNEYGASCDT